jgi:voltage-gated potassium channel
MSAAAYTIGGLIQMLTEGEIERAIGRHRATRGIEQLSGHVIICGYGRIGHILAEDLERQGLQFVIIDSDADCVVDAELHKYLVVRGNATEESTLIAAGVQRAKTLISALNSDADNVFLTLTSRNLAPGLTIIARGEHPKSEKKLVQAGADRVVLPAVIGARRIATMVTRPHAAEVLDQLTDHKILDVDLEELSLGPEGPLVGKTVLDVEAHIKHRLLVVAVRKHGGKTIFNPDADYVFEGQDMMIVMGRPEDIQRFRATYGI